MEEIMRKRYIIAVLLACTALPSLLMSGCTASPDKKESKPAATADSANTSKVTADVNSKIFHGKNSKEKIEALINSKAMKDKKSKFVKNAKSKGYNFDMSYGEDEKHNPLLIFKYTAKSSISEDNKKKMENSLESNSEYMDNLALSMQQNMGISDAAVRVIVTDSNSEISCISNDYSGKHSDPNEPEIPPETATGEQSSSGNQTESDVQSVDGGENFSGGFLDE